MHIYFFINIYMEIIYQYGYSFQYMADRIPTKSVFYEIQAEKDRGNLTGIEKYPAGYILGKEIRKSRIFRFAKKVRRRNKRNKIYKKSTDCL